MSAFFTHLLAGVVGAGAATGLITGALRAVTLPGKQARGIAKVLNKIAPNLQITGAQVQQANVAAAEAVVGQVAAKEEGANAK